MDKDCPIASTAAYSPLIESDSEADQPSHDHQPDDSRSFPQNDCRSATLRIVPIIPFVLLLIGLYFESKKPPTIPSGSTAPLPLTAIPQLTTTATAVQHPNECNISYPEGALRLDAIGEKYIGVERRVTCARLGNFFYREASFYAFAKALGRKRVLDADEALHCPPDFYRFRRQMPNMAEYLRIMNTSQMSVAVVAAAEDNGARGEQPEKWRFCDEAELILADGLYYQSYMNFHHLKAEIRQLFQFTEKFMENVEALRDEVFGDDRDSHKFCIHARRTDFLSRPASFLEASHLDFAIPAAEYILQKLRVELANEAEAAESEHHWAHPHRVISGLRRLHSYFRNSTAKISVVLFSDDQQHFGRLIRPDPTLYAKRYVMPDRKMDSTMVMAFANKYCDSFLMTSSSSTFGWWIAYLMPEERQRRVFYNIKSSTNSHYGAYAFDYRTYPTEWQRLHLNESGIIEVEPRWITELVRDNVMLRRR